MRPAWRLGISSLSGRRSRTALLICAVAMSAALIAAVACAMSSMQEGLRKRIETSVGAADVRVQRIGRELIDSGVLARIESWPEVKLAVGRAVGPVALKNPRVDKDASTVGNGIDPERERLVHPMQLAEGRLATGPGEVAIDLTTVKELDAKLGDVLDVQRWGEPIKLTVVGIIRPATVGMGLVTRPESYVTVDTLGAITNKPGKVREVDIVLKPGADPEAVAKAHEGSLGAGVLINPATKITTGLDRSQKSSQIGMTIASALAMLSGAFIIMTGLTTGVTERLRELAMVRCIGGTRGQLAESQLAIGLIVGVLGAIAGVPLGALGAFVLVHVFSEQFPGGFTFNRLGVALGVAAAVLAGLLGAIYPAIRAARTSPLEALSARAKVPSLRGIFLCGVVGVLLAMLHMGLFLSSRNGDVLFASDLAIGLPAVFTGYFLLAVPLLWLATTAFGPLLSAQLRTPAGMLVRTVHGTPYRFGFTAGAMSLGLALLVAIWTNGRAIDRDWLAQFKFPDAFAAGLSISQNTQDRIAALPFVRSTTPITVQSFKTDAFGLKLLENTNTSFVAFDPDQFLSMANLQWIEGDPAAARERLKQGGAVLIAKEFHVTRGLGVGDTLRLMYNGKPYEFQIVGVVSSPGLEIVSRYFEIGDEFMDMAVNAVFGTREDLKRLFNNTSVRLLQIDFKNDPQYAAMNDDQVEKLIRTAGGSEVLMAGSGRGIIDEIRGYISASLYVFSLVAVAAMLVACFGVANLIVAGIQARQYEFGVLRAIGAERGTVARLVLGEAILIAITACILGTVMGLQASWAGQRMYEVLLGLVLTLRLPLNATAAGWGILTVITVGAAMPAVLALNGKKPRELLGAVRG